MKEFCVSLSSVEKIKDFVNVTNRIDGKVFLLSGRYTVDAKSIMGIFSLDLSKPMNLEIEVWKEEYKDMFERFLYKS